ncbi:DUF4249 domain-containing protein [Flagellimonas onchidii]|uniref:DUF4249 domain-containing protein n=1 Tax=Flagellimonas onchidii TaxID=2562684 RepID=UPI0010A62F1E|nr:DUF4249 domain-containing protein [Allomuricauda onchidii]
MTKERLKYALILPMALLCLEACIEPFEATFPDFESAIVIEATLTDELERQTVFITRTFEFEEDGPLPESNASVQVVAGSETHTFVATAPGIYVSEQAFSAQPNVTYQLRIGTQDGRTYISREMTLPASTQMDDVTVERMTNDDGVEGVAILVDSFDSTGSSVNYRYEYEETYKIIAPFWRPNDLEKVPPAEQTELCEVRVIPDTRSEETCYATDISNAIIQTSTTNLSEDRVDNFMVRFIPRDNYIISHRYSILIKQFVQSNAAYTFYETLNQFSGNESLFSETQPGFLEGNVFSEQSRDEKVLGYFEVASVSKRRIFFNYDDLFPGEDLPPYTDPCIINAPPLSKPGQPPRCVLSSQVELGLVGYVDANGSPGLGEGPYLIVPNVCGDCSEIGNPEPPEFWIE